MRSEFQAVPFEEFEKAELNLARLEQQLAPTLMAPLASLLAHSPDADGALNFLERYAQEAPAEVLGEIARQPVALSYLVAIFGYSGFLAETLLSEPSLVIQFAGDRNFTKLKSKEDLMQDYARFATTNPDAWLAAQLARFKRRNYLRIAMKDVLGLSTLGETTLELATLADVILTNALLFCDGELEKRYGQPQYYDPQGRIARSGFSIISLGKLGGNELNYSSDIDLLYLYSHDGETAGGNESVVTNKEYFVRLANAITRTITQPTPQGEVFRVDLRLRPEGEQGDLAISLKSSLEYYEHRARDWELQMLIKARHSAGDARLTRDFLRGVEQEIYGSPGDFEAVESVLWSRERLSRKMQENGGQAVDVKHHQGGIRDIEFLAQCLQRLYGGQDAWVRSGGTLFALRKLNDKGWLSDRDYARLTNSYVFLRRVEHCVQLELGQQTHRLPAGARALDRLARRVGVAVSPPESPGQALLQKLQDGFEKVDEIYQRMIHPRTLPSPSKVFELQPLPSITPGFGQASYESTLGFLEAQAPEVAAQLREAEIPERSRKAAARYLTSLLESPERFALVREKPELLRRALEVVRDSEHLGELLIRHPEDMIVLDAPEIPPAAGQLEIALEGTEAEDASPHPWALEPVLAMRQKMAVLRRHFLTRVLELGAADLTARESSMRELKRWSAMARRCIASALQIAESVLETKNLVGGNRPRPFAVLALGRLALNEFDLASDADLMFVTGPEVGREELDFWKRLAAKMIDVLSSYTREGTVFAVDTRLRPRGQEGELVVTQEELLSYVREDAQVWEGLTYLKACHVAGNAELGRETVARLVTAIFDRFATSPTLANDLRQMRWRLEREVAVPPTNTKTAPGGYYDIDFAVSLLRLRGRVAVHSGANMGEQIAALRSAGLMNDSDSKVFSDAANFLRGVDHAIRLVTGKAADGFPERAGHAEAVENLARRWGLIAGSQTLAQCLQQTREGVRQVYHRLVEAAP
jgi:glutamate-ammonia-ligase adenylyltransferase